MKRIILSAVLSALSIPAFAADPAHAHHAAAAAADAPLSEGTVKKLDKAAGKVTLAHGPLANLGMPAMTMSFKVKDAAWLERMKTGDKIRFLVEDAGGVYTVVRYEPAR